MLHAPIGSDINGMKWWMVRWPLQHVELDPGFGSVGGPKMAKVRCHDRMVYERAVVYRMIESVACFESFGKTTNFSFGGCMFEARDRFEQTTFLELRIPTERGVAFVDSAVVFVNEIKDRRFQIGVKFVRLLPEDRYRLEGEMQDPRSWARQPHGFRFA